MPATSGEQLGFDVISDSMPTKLVRVTPARLARWRDCPRRYRMTYVDRPSPARGGAWAHSTLGANVHNALRAYFSLPLARRTQDAAAAMVVKYWRADGFADVNQSDRYRERAAGWVADYVASLVVGIDPVGVERWVAAPVGTIVVEGRVDRVDEREGELVIVDYKTGRHTPSNGDAEASQALALYALAAGRMLHQTCMRVELHHLPTGTVAGARHGPSSLTGHAEAAQREAAEFTDATDRLAAGDDQDELFAPIPGRHCAWCEFRSSCPEGRAATAEPEPWAMLAP